MRFGRAVTSVHALASRGKSEANMTIHFAPHRTSADVLANAVDDAGSPVCAPSEAAP